MIFEKWDGVEKIGKQLKIDQMRKCDSWDCFKNMVYPRYSASLKADLKNFLPKQLPENSYWKWWCRWDILWLFAVYDALSHNEVHLILTTSLYGIFISWTPLLIIAYTASAL